MTPEKASYLKILEEGGTPPSLYTALAKKWKASTSNSLALDCQTRTGYDIKVGAQADTGTGILSFLGSLVSRRSAGLEHLMLAVVSAEEDVDLVHSLF